MDNLSNLQEKNNLNPHKRIIGSGIAEAILVADYTLQITFTDKTIQVINFKPYLAMGAIYKRFLLPENFAKFKVDKYGMRLYWPGNILDFHYSNLYQGLKKS